MKLLDELGRKFRHPARLYLVRTCVETTRDVDVHYEVSPDHNGLVGEAPGVERFLYATGFSGHGFMQAPAVGEIVRDLVLGREPFVDVSPLAAERFALHAPRPEHNVI